MSEIDLQTVPIWAVVLVVDGDADVRRTARRVLEVAGYGVVEASNSTDGLRMIDAGTKVDFLVVDLDLPDSGGDELAIQARARLTSLKVVYLTAHIASLMTRRREVSRDEGFVEKPLTGASLLDALTLLKTGRKITAEPARVRVPWRKRWLGF
jgi:CheY-like chemotaxis protein